MARGYFGKNSTDITRHSSRRASRRRACRSGPMALACENGNPDVVRALLEAGADAARATFPRAAVAVLPGY